MAAASYHTCIINSPVAPYETILQGILIIVYNLHTTPNDSTVAPPQPPGVCVLPNGKKQKAS